MNSDMPVLTFELGAIKRRVSAVLLDNNNEINEMVIKTIETELTTVLEDREKLLVLIKKLSES